MNIKNISGCVALLLSFFSSNVFSQLIDSDDLLAAENFAERGRQVNRQISDDITNQLVSLIAPNAGLPQFAGLAGRNPLGASADANSMMPDSAWFSSSWTEISDDDLGGHFDSDIYQFSGGIDKQMGNFYLGLATTYAYTESELVGFGSQGDNHSITVTPYAAYVINKNFFISGLTSYTYSSDEPDNNALTLDTDNHSATVELLLNGLTVIDAWTLSGKAGARYNHTETSFDRKGVSDSNSDDWTYLIDAKIAYSFEKHIKGLRVYGGALFEHLDSENSADDGVLYMRGGIDYSLNKDFTVGVKYSHDVNNEDLDLSTVGLNAQLAF